MIYSVFIFNIYEEGINIFSSMLEQKPEHLLYFSLVLHKTRTDG